MKDVKRVHRLDARGRRHPERDRYGYLLCPVHCRRLAFAWMQEEWGLTKRWHTTPVVIDVREREAEIWCSPVYRRRPASVDWMKSSIPTAVIGVFAGKAPLGALVARPLCGCGPGSPDFARATALYAKTEPRREAARNRRSWDQADSAGVNARWFRLRPPDRSGIVRRDQRSSP
ncbi:hypothetical protein DF3PB_2030001 [uncultured Defluviicoccus sp.]|uniref:Uncharacterized protein n=1 Tax=metagenome TaxID=256318 RepID=A0A380TCH6_9ZZZZ|nr:hypothetical protein DF3PB_2030001 [uncultured Defluviicoccus sp.]